MLIMTQDRISGLSASKTPLSSYGPGNTRDDSNRNSWVSSDGTDSLTINCFGQVNGLFLGRYQADELLLTFQGDEFFRNKTSSGSVSVGYSNNSNTQITGTVGTPIDNPGGYFYSGGSLIEITLTGSDTTDFVNVNDLIKITSSVSNSPLEGNYRVVQVQKNSSFTKLNIDGNSEVFQNQDGIGEKIQVITSDQASTIAGISGETATISSGLSIPIVTIGNIVGFVNDEDDIALTYKVGFTIPNSSLLKTGDSPFTVGEFISLVDCKIETDVASTPIECENLDYSGNSYKSYYVTAITEGNVGFEIFVKPNIFFSKNSVRVVTTSGSPSADFGSTFYYNGGGFQHKLGLGLVAGSTTTQGVETFENIEVVQLSSPTISSVSNFDVSQITLNDVAQTFLHKATVKDRAQFSIKLPFKVKAGSSSLSDVAFSFGTGDSIEIRKYVTDTGDASTTTEGPGTPIRRTNIATRTQNTIADFVTGKLNKVESNYIPLPREAFPTKILIEMNATINHNASNLFNQFLLEEVDIEKPTSASASKPTSENSDLSSSTYYDSIDTYLYNSNDDGELTLNINTVDTSIVAGDHIYLYWPNDIAAQNSTITKTTSAGSTSLMIKMADPIHELYEGMKIAGSSDKHILSLDKSVNEITTNIAHGINTVGASVTFDHHASLGDDASAGWTGIHRVKSASANGREIKIIVPNSGTKGDLTINSSAGPKSATGAYIVKVKNGKGRFVRPITSGITSADAFFFNSGTTDVEYSFGSPSQTYVIKPGTAQLLFSEPHSLVNNDKIILYDLSSSTGGANLRGLDSSYLVTYTTSNMVSIDIKQSSSVVVSALRAQVNTGSDNDLLVITSTDHGFSVGNKVTLNNLPNSPTNYSGFYTVKTTPTAKSFTVDVGADVATSYNPIGQTLGGTAKATTGVHYLQATGQTLYTDSTTPGNITGVLCSRSISISDAISAFENPVEVGNLIYRDGLQSSSGQYDSVNISGAVFSKTPNIDDSASTTPYRPDSDTAIQNTFTGTANSVVSQINLIRGDATSQFDVQLEKPFGLLNKPVVFTKLLQGLRLAILRAGISRELPNPQVGVTNNFKDYSVRKELPTGAYYYLNRDSAKEFSGRILSDPDNVDLLTDFGAEQLARPFPCLIISGNQGNMKKLRTRTALYGYFTSLPQATFSTKLNNLKEASFSIREVL